MNPLSKQNSYKNERSLYTSVVTAPTDFYAASHRLSQHYVCSGVYSHMTDRLSHQSTEDFLFRYKVFGVHNNWKAIVMIVYADNVV